VLVLAARVVPGEELPMVSIPKIDPEKAGNVTRRQAFSAEVWAGAAKVSLFTDTGHGPGVPEETSAYLFHDGAKLYAAFVCTDWTRSGRALAREYGEDLTQDEAVQILLGVGDGAGRKQIEVGGYEGAQGVTLPPVAHFYEFTVNAAGSVSRHYNETLLPNPGFAATVLTSQHRWCAVFTLPLSVVGVTEVDGRKLYFNLFRFYRGKRYGFHYPGFGNYQPMPFATALFLPAGQDNRASEIGTKAPAPANTKGLPPSHPVQVEYFPLSRKVCAKFPAAAGRRTATLALKGTDFAAQARLSPTRSTVVTLALPAAGVPGEFTAVAGAEGEADRLERNFPCFAGPAPEWYGSKAGMEYTDRKVSYPWTSPLVAGRKVKLAHADMGFGPSALPAEINLTGRQLLAGALTVDARANGRVLGLAKLGEVKPEPTRALFDSAATAKGIQVRTMVDFDGFMVVRLRTRGVGASALEKLEVRIPLSAGVARYVNRGSVQDTLAIFGGGYSGNASELWVGSENAGIAFSYDRNCFFTDPNGRQLEVVQKPAGTSELIIRLVSGKGQVVEDDQVFQFFLQGTPFRAEPVPPLQAKTSLWFEEWSDYQGYPDLRKLGEVKERAAKAHAEGKLFFTYFSQCLAGNSPGFTEYGNEWVAPPERAWYRRAYDPGKGVPCYVSCFRGAAGDLLLDGFQRLADEGDLDGLYFDGPSYPFECESLGHNCSDSLPAAWEDDFQTGRILGQRKFLKRARGILNDKGRRHLVWAHTGGGLNLATLALCDVFYEGEQLSRYRHGYMVDPAKFLVGYSGKPFGFRTFLLPVLYFDAAHDARVAGALGLLHDVETSFGDYKPAAQDLFFSLPRERDPDAVFYGYWAEQPHIRTDRVLPVSYYRGRQEAMLVIGNVKYEGSKTVTIRLGGMFDTDTIDVLAYGGRNTLTRDCRELKVTVEEGGLRLFRLTPAGTAPDLPPAPEPAGEKVVGFKPVTAFSPDDWTLKGNTQPVPADVDLDLPYLKASVLYSDEVTAALSKPLPRDFTLKMRVAFTTVFRLTIDEAVVNYDGWTPWSLSGFNTLDPLGVCVARPRASSSIYPEVKQGEVADLCVVCKDDRLTILYDGKFIADRMLPLTVRKPHNVQFATWGGQWMGLDVVSIEEGGEHPVREQVHPVR
jgi:hypothetical protein